jgi:tetratricopeptide (TPR) repeat protein
MNPSRLAFLLLPILTLSAGAQDDRPSSQPTADLDKSLKGFLIEKKDAALRDCLTALAQKGKDGMARLSTVATRVMSVARKTAGDGAKAADASTTEAEAPKETAAWLEDLISGDDAKAEAAAQKLTEAGKSVAAPVKSLAARTDSLLIQFVADHIRRQSATGAIFAGQYDDLRALKPAVERVLVQFAKEAPVQLGDAFRVAAIQALRDVVTDKPSEEVTKTLKGIAEDDFEVEEAQKHAVWALAQFGDRSLVEAKIQKATELTKNEDADEQAAGWAELAETHYHLRDYPAAIDAYKKLLALAEEGKWKSPSLSTTYYNAACSMALAGRNDEAFEYIDKAMVAGRKGSQSLRATLFEHDMDIENLRKDPRFPAMMEKYFGKRPGGAKGTDEGKESR